MIKRIEVLSDSNFNFDAELAKGIEIEHEHRPTWEKIKIMFDKGKLIEPEALYQSIAIDHINEHPSYYLDPDGGLVHSEEILDNKGE